MSIERPYRIGDWIELDDGKIGRVIDVTWRSTRLISRYNTVYVVPNGRAANSILHNLDQPDRTYGYTFHIKMAPEVPPPLVRQILLEACLSAELVLDDPPPVIRLWDIEKRPYDYLVAVRFKDYETCFLARDNLLLHVWRHLESAGLTPAAEARESFTIQAMPPSVPEADVRALLRRVELFHDLAPEEIDHLLGTARAHTLRAGETIVEEGAHGDSLFVVMAGVVRITRGSNGAGVVELARLGAGSYFGEMSLLTGEPRSAKVAAYTECEVLEVRRQDLEPVLEARPELIEDLAQVMAERRLRNEAIGTRGPEGAAEQFRTYVNDLRRRIDSFFRMPSRGAAPRGCAGPSAEVESKVR